MCVWHRRQADAEGIAKLMTSLVPAVRGGSNPVVRTILEQPVPNSLNGKHSWWSTGFSYGVWNGVLQSLGLPVETVSARRWKNEMLLNGKGKEGSRLLAQQLFPHAAKSLTCVLSLPSACAPEAQERVGYGV